MINVVVYIDQNQQSAQLIQELSTLQPTIPHQLVVIDLNQDPDLKARYGKDAPILRTGPYMLKSPIEIKQLEVTLKSAQDRTQQISQVGDPQQEKKLSVGQKVTGVDRFSVWFSKKYILFFNLFLALYIGLPFLGPVLMKADLILPAKIVYGIFYPLCHQLPYRSLFLFGKQMVYPLERAGLPNSITYEQITGRTQLDVLSDRTVIGDQYAGMGYKVAICERCISMYGGLLVFGLIFAVAKRRIKGIPWYLWLSIGVVPLGIDGVSQLPASLTALINFPAWVPLRESTPFLRFLTGGLFGILTAWYIYPRIEEMMKDTYEYVTVKINVEKKSSDKEAGNHVIS